MTKFNEYSRSFSVSYEPDLLDYSTWKNDEFAIYKDSELLRTPGGNFFSYTSEALIRTLVTDLQLLHDSPSENRLSSPVLFSYCLDVLQNEEDPFMKDADAVLKADPFVTIKSAGREGTGWQNPDDSLFSFSFITLSGLMNSVNRFAGRVMGEIVMDEDEPDPFSEIVRLSYSRLSLFGKGALHALSGCHDSGIVLPLLLINGEISPVEYVKGVISLKIRSSGVFQALLSETALIVAFLNSPGPDLSGNVSVGHLLNEGESDRIEFKSTLRWDIRAGKTNPAIERACLKTISAFLNSIGGTLLIGVRDDGSVEGIETDKFPNDDKFLLHLWMLIRTCLGKDYAPFVKTKLEKTEEKTICIVLCSPSDRPVFLRQPGYPEEMFIRMGPSSNALNISEALKYIGKRFR